MGNCIKHSSSAAAAQSDVKPAEAVNYSCDNGTIESSSYTTISPPASPVKPDIPTEVKQGKSGEPVSAASQQASPKIEENSQTTEQQREEGQRRLRELVISGANAGDIDWKSIIALAEDLHRKEQQLLRSYNEQRFGKKLSTSSGGSSRRNISRRQAFFEKRRRRRETSRRRKLESVGSFSVNLLMYEADDERCRQGSSPTSENDASSFENTIDDSEEKLDVFEDDDPSPLHHDISCFTLPRYGAERPGTPSPFMNSSPIVITDTEGSFMAATSLFDSAEDECSSNSSSNSSISSTSQEKNWDLMTIDEDATVIDW
mmetsp:Transcript_7407/g.16792  ORF Transcript_7407/g.16792 Transcript_7407/m.16792 type:complete len:316 (+) Transcript_7407:250-1197(+)|eukprot:CAMPEP_0172313746 /NCGR_PEP_ID=MMETSP1058-20130122/20859_1 /TAXON_ID=83371 /ORGANISM="Detonula confervacea, Strain CCMP 353" /LENGTH=315 /DNA_ID=CAMNT_0013027449 /DNA_START=138 /DNA_END=1085 /DNA_ORIENTATION=-